MITLNVSLIAGFRHWVNGALTCLGYYAALIGSYQRFVTSCRSHLQGTKGIWRLKMGPTGCPETLRRLFLEDGTYRLSRNVRTFVPWRWHWQVVSKRQDVCSLKMGPTGCLETSGRLFLDDGTYRLSRNVRTFVPWRWNLQVVSKRQDICSLMMGPTGCSETLRCLFLADGTYRSSRKVGTWVLRNFPEERRHRAAVNQNVGEAVVSQSASHRHCSIAVCLTQTL